MAPASLRQQHLAGLEVGELRDLGGGERAALHVAALDDQGLVVALEVAERLGGVHRLPG